MLLSDLSIEKIKSGLKIFGLGYKAGPFNISVTSNIPAVTEHIRYFYSHYNCNSEAVFVDFHVEVNSVGGYRRWYKPQVTFVFDGYEPFVPLPINQAPAMFEWGLNWAIANTAHQYLIIHSAIIEKDGYGLIMPGTPGSGKSTLCAALVNRGWRLLSDEMALLSLADGLIYPAPRPVSLKNKSIDVIGQFAPELSIGPHAYGTDKGTVAHVVPPWSSIERQHELAPPISRIVFPKYKAGSQSSLVQLKETDTIMQLIEGTFNYNALGEKGFLAITDVVSNSKCQKFTYSSLDDAITVFEDFTN